MSIVVKLGGCNGSGKTSLVSDIIFRAVSEPVTPRGARRPEAYRGMYEGIPVYILGSYENVCGGMDTISDKEDRLKLIKKYVLKDGIVFFEGLITGKTYGAIGEISDKQKGRWIYAFMDTPFETCVERVLQRRKARGNMAPFDPERTMRPTFKACASVARRAQEMGHEVVLVNHKLAPAKASTHLLALAVKRYQSAA